MRGREPELPAPPVGDADADGADGARPELDHLREARRLELEARTREALGKADAKCQRSLDAAALVGPHGDCGRPADPTVHVPALGEHREPRDAVWAPQVEGGRGRDLGRILQLRLRAVRLDEQRAAMRAAANEDPAV